MTKDEKHKRTRKLLKNYRLIRSACELQQGQRAAEAEAYSESLLWFNRLMLGKDPDRIIQEVKNTSDRTASLLAVIDHAIDECRAGAAGSLSSWRQFDALYSVYFQESPGSIPDLCGKWQCGKTTLYRDLQQAEDSIALFLFPEE